MNYKLLLALPLATALMTSGCDMEVPNSEITSQLTDVGRCGMSHGIPITAQQAKKIKSMVDLINSKETIDSASVAKHPDLGNGCSSTQSVAVALAKIRGDLNGQTLYHNTAHMKSLYQLAYGYYDAGDDEQDTYCACGVEFCDAGVGCAKDLEMNTEICSSNTSLVADKSKGVVESDIACNPVNLSFTGLSNTLVEHQLPLLMHMAFFRSYENAITIQENADVKNVIVKDSYEDEDYNEATVLKARKIYQFLIECLNAGDSASFSEDGTIVSSCLSLKNINALDETKPCLQNDNGKASRIPNTHCKGEIYLAAANKNANFYATVRALAKNQLELHNAEADDADKLPVDNEAIDKYLIDQAALIFSERIATNMDATVRGIYDMVESGVTPSVDQVFGALQHFLNEAYNNALLSSEQKKAFALHRQFFAWLTVLAIDPSALSGLYTGTFTVRLECHDQDTIIGDKSGLKKYCISDDNLTMSIADILSFLSDKNNSERIVYLADALIMGNVVSFKNGDQTLTIDVPKSEIIGQDKETGDQKALSGKWLIMRCPDDASCMANGQCGSCTNGTMNAEGKVCTNGVFPK